ncbi:hypothetical protein HF394_02715 [Planococcus glaciei]|uniref:Uncharacterized protein n=1 Tax=Planococcus glaciei TaxID=459472 RepID=A0A7H8Q6J1_9BACL|nr:DUF5693 family protein [Planococcus glaciei]ETP67619.1 hypothetical protein G159_16095 [Planococcus glaciei CHR43]QKX49578.1 hypothetical protein HF394_02715 [Planococcus glaciei]
MQKVLIAVVLAALILTIPSIVQRVQVEKSSDTVETVVPYKLVHQWLGSDSVLTRDQIFADLKEAGVQSISLEPDTLRTLERKGIITAVNSARMREHLLLNRQEPLDEFYNKEGLFVASSPDFPLKETTDEMFEETHAIKVNGVDYVFIPGFQDTILSSPVGYDEEVADAAIDAGFTVIPRIADYGEDQMRRMADNLLALKREGIEKVLFLGAYSPFYREPDLLKEFSEEMKETGYTLIQIEGPEQVGFGQAAYAMDLDVVRLHSVPVNPAELSVFSERIVRAVKERNIRSIFLNTKGEEYDEEMDGLKTIRADVDAGLSSNSRGKAAAFDSYEVPLWQTAAGLIGAIAFLGLAVDVIVKNRKLTFLTLAGTALLALIYMLFGLSIILKAMALAIAVSAPVLAVLLHKKTDAKGYLLIEYAKAVAVTLVGIWFIVVLLNGNQFLLGIDSFRGVKLVYILPMAFIALYAIWGNFKFLLNMNVKYWHMLIFALIAVLGLYYISRTGNTGSVSAIELQVRQALEQILYVRPRTKEFLIGFPLFVVALYVAKRNVKASYFLLVPAVIGFLSMVNTFTHLHIPLSISLLRSVYSIILGFIIGGALILLYKWIGTRIVDQIKARWQF